MGQETNRAIGVVEANAEGASKDVIDVHTAAEAKEGPKAVVACYKEVPHKRVGPIQETSTGANRGTSRVVDVTKGVGARWKRRDRTGPNWLLGLAFCGLWFQLLGLFMVLRLLFLLLTRLLDGLKECRPRDVRKIKWLLNRLFVTLCPFLRDENAKKESPDTAATNK